MSKLDVIFKKNTIGGSERFDAESAKRDVKALFLELVDEAQRDFSAGENFPETLRQKVEEL